MANKKTNTVKKKTTTSKKTTTKKTNKVKNNNVKKSSPKKIISNKKKVEEKISKIKYSDVIAILIGIICSVIFVVCIINIVDWFSANKETKKIEEETKIAIKGKLKNKEIDLKKLKEQNSDTVAYIQINNTKIDYPVVKTTNNRYYLTHNFNKKGSQAGWIFANYANKFDGTDKNISLFGHARLDGSMFGSLKTTLTKEWQSDEKNLIITFITENEKSKYQVFSTYKIKEEDYYIKSDFRNNEFNEFLGVVKKRSNKDYKVELNEQDKVLTLSTCDINDKYRIVLHAKKIRNNSWDYSFFVIL